MGEGIIFIIPIFGKCKVNENEIGHKERMLFFTTW